MIEARDFVDACLKREFSQWTGVPCSMLTPLIHYVQQNRNLDYVGASSEGEAVAIAAGAYLAGGHCVAICQNSGLGNMVNPLASLVYPFRIPLLLVVTHRGAPDAGDEPQHELMGRITGPLLTQLGIEWEPFPEQTGAIEGALERALESMEGRGLPFAFVMRPGAVADYPLKRARRVARPVTEPIEGGFTLPPGERMPRREAIARVRGALAGCEAVVATTGKTARELFALGHRSSQFYLLGAMGCAPAIGFGIQRLREKRDVVVLDGDGAALMRLGSLATIGHHAPARFTHVLLDNEAHDSTGGQPTAASTVDFAAVASACGYRSVFATDDPGALEARIRETRRKPGPHFLHVKVARGSDPDLGRPTLTPVQVKAQFMDWVAQA